ncbi:uncharacterized protein LOC110724068 [Chenopodium quinoa]|uniref:uncharacterized protein LOC110724068 n=1 Tax=Chenopodium quinoa TaxID=63459 RepID=UPI000B785DD0|nr:uncharacterized protein LOC110724068 [Chenopodium quinoa]
MEFFKFALENNSEGRDKLPCPCYICHNLMYHKADVILNHLSKRQFDRTYTCWHRHVEKREEISSKDAQGHNTDEGNELEDMTSQFVHRVDDDLNVTEEMLSDSEKPLYEGCKYTKLSASLKLYSLKEGHSWTDKSFTTLLEFLIDVLPSDNVFPKNTYRAKKNIMYNGFKLMYSDPVDVEKLTWHKFGLKKDGLLRHPADSPQWRFINGQFPEFGSEERNLHLGLSTDGNDIDVYLAPLIDDLKLLWEEGVEVFDANRNEMFNLRAMLFCTIQDYPAYGNLSSYYVKGEGGCPICEDGWKGKWLSASRKTVYYDHRPFIPLDHKYYAYRKECVDSLIGTLLNISGKTKDGVNARLDLKEMNMRNELNAVETGKRDYFPLAAYTLSKKEKVELCASLAGV